MNNITGKNKWAFSGGNIPLKGTGKEPEFLSYDKISILNCSDKDTTVKIKIFFNDEKPAGEYELEVKAERVRKFRVNDLIDPHAIPLGVPYGCFIDSKEPVIVQFTRQNTSQDNMAIMGAIAYSEEGDQQFIN